MKNRMDDLIEIIEAKTKEEIEAFQKKIESIRCNQAVYNKLSALGGAIKDGKLFGVEVLIDKFLSDGKVLLFKHGFAESYEPSLYFTPKFKIRK